MFASGSISPLESIRRTFSLLVDARALPAIDVWALGVDATKRYLAACDLQALLRERTTEPSLRDAIWGEFVRRARSDEQPWILFATGLMLPGLVKVTYQVLNRHGGDRHDIEGTVLMGFVEAVKSSDPSMRKLSTHLKQVALQRALAARELTAASFDAAEMVCTDVLRPVPLVAPPGHPDLVLARAVRDGVIAKSEADIIAATRLDDVDLAVVAAQLRLPYLECAGRRQRAELELQRYLLTGEA